MHVGMQARKRTKISVTTIFSQVTIRIAILERMLFFNGATRGLLPKSWEEYIVYQRSDY
jgi:hypothetical protein